MLIFISCLMTTHCECDRLNIRSVFWPLIHNQESIRTIQQLFEEELISKQVLSPTEKWCSLTKSLYKTYRHVTKEFFFYQYSYSEEREAGNAFTLQ